MYSVDFQRVEPLMRKGDWDGISKILIDIAKKLELVGADVIIIATNTMHKMYDKIQSSISIPLIHISDTLAVDCQKNNVHNVGLLGTYYTMTDSTYR